MWRNKTRQNYSFGTKSKMDFLQFKLKNCNESCSVIQIPYNIMKNKSLKMRFKPFKIYHFPLTFLYCKVITDCEYFHPLIKSVFQSIKMFVKEEINFFWIPVRFHLQECGDRI